VPLKKRFDQARPFLALGLVVGAWLILPVIVKRFARASFFELQAPIAVTASHVRDLQEYWSFRTRTNHELVEAGRDAANIAASYALGVQQNTTLLADIARLEHLLGMMPFDQYRMEHTRVVRRDFSGWWQRLTIRKGKNFNIPVGAPVVYSGGVVGRVTEVYAMTSVVELISSPGVRLAAAIEGDPRPISFQGGLNPTFGPAKAVVDYVPLDVTPPRRLVTSGLGVFPPGLSLGELTELSLSNDGLFKVGKVKLDDRLSSLVEVTVLVPTKSD
jgi:rod shape-determining protein MreC